MPRCITAMRAVACPIKRDPRRSCPTALAAIVSCYYTTGVLPGLAPQARRCNALSWGAQLCMRSFSLDAL